MTRPAILALVSTNASNITPINTNGVQAITGAIMNTALNNSVGLNKLVFEIAESYFNLESDTTDNIADTPTNRFVTDIDISNWNNKVEHGETVTVSVVVTPTTTTINYLDHASNPQSVVVVTGVAVTATGVVD